MPSTKSASSIVALPYRCEVCSPTIPACSGCLSEMAPQPMRVGMTGVSSSSASSTSFSDASALMTPPPATITGRWLAHNMSSTFAACAGLIAGFATGSGS